MVEGTYMQCAQGINVLLLTILLVIVLPIYEESYHKISKMLQDAFKKITEEPHLYPTSLGYQKSEGTPEDIGYHFFDKIAT